MKKKYSFGGIVIAFIKCAVYIAAWFVISFAVSLLAEIIFFIMNPGISVSELFSLIMSKNVDITLLANVCIILLFSVFYRLLRHSSLKSAIRLRSIPPKHFFSVIFLGVAFQFVVLLILNIIPFPANWFNLLEDTGASVAQTGNTFILYLSVAIIGPITEELVFRGLMLNKLNQNMPSLIAVILSSAIFGAMHANPIGFIYAGMFGLVLGWLYIKFDSILPCALFHIAYNATSLLLTNRSIPVFICIFSVIAVVYVMAKISKYRLN